MVSDYISRNAAIEAMYKDAEAHPGHTFWTSQNEALRNIPAADVREVVLCRDCKNYIERSGACAYLVVGMREDDFCSYGKKREES